MSHNSSGHVLAAVLLQHADRLTEAADLADAELAAALKVAGDHQSEVEHMLAAHHAAEREDQASWTLSLEDAADARARVDARFEDQMRRSGARLELLRKHLTSFVDNSVPPGGPNSQEN